MGDAMSKDGHFTAEALATVEYWLGTEYGGPVTGSDRDQFNAAVRVVACALRDLLAPVPPRCATCRWAQPDDHTWAQDDVPWPFPQLSLRCVRGDMDAGGNVAEPLKFWAGSLDEDRLVEAVLTVTPDFGCVAWEAKP